MATSPSRPSGATSVVVVEAAPAVVAAAASASAAAAPAASPPIGATPAFAAASAGSPPAAPSTAAATAAPDATSRCLRDESALAVRHDDAAGCGWAGPRERATEPFRRLGDAPAIRAEPVHCPDSVARSAQRVAERTQERPVLVDARQQHDLGQSGRSRTPAGRRRPASSDRRPWRREQRQLSHTRVRVVGGPPGEASGQRQRLGLGGHVHVDAHGVAAGMRVHEPGHVLAGRDHRLVPAVGHLDVAAAGQEPRDLLSPTSRRDVVVLAPDHQGRRGDARQGVLDAVVDHEAELREVPSRSRLHVREEGEPEHLRLRDRLVLQQAQGLHRGAAFPRVHGGGDEHHAADELGVPRRGLGDDLRTGRVAHEHGRRAAPRRRSAPRSVARLRHAEWAPAFGRVAEARQVERKTGRSFEDVGESVPVARATCRARARARSRGPSATPDSGSPPRARRSGTRACSPCPAV